MSRPKSAYAGSNSPLKDLRVWSLPRSSGVEDRVLRGRSLRTPPGPEGSNGKEILLGAAGLPGWSRLAVVSQARKFDGGCTAIPLVVCNWIDHMMFLVFLMPCTRDSRRSCLRLPLLYH